MSELKKEEKKVEEPKAAKAAEPRVELGTFVSCIYMVNPYTKTKFEKNVPVEKVVIDSWTRCQIEAGILTEC